MHNRSAIRSGYMDVLSMLQTYVDLFSHKFADGSMNFVTNLPHRQCFSIAVCGSGGSRLSQNKL